jgi:hypothetical protein
MGRIYPDNSGCLQLAAHRAGTFRLERNPAGDAAQQSCVSAFLDSLCNLEFTDCAARDMHRMLRGLGDVCNMK